MDDREHECTIERNRIADELWSLWGRKAIAWTATALALAMVVNLYWPK